MMTTPRRRLSEGGRVVKITLICCRNILIAFLTLSMSALGVTAAATSGGQDSADTARNVELTNAAWDAFRHHRYEDAIAAAERCASRFKSDADQTQADLENKKAKALPKGKVSEQQKKAIYDQGVINDVATCYWIKGRSAQLLHRNDAAREAYSATMRYSYARTWDPRGWFWSPAEDAADRLQDLK